MTTLIDAVQKQDPGSELVELFELELPAGTQYFHSGLEADSTTVQFREKASPYDIKTYTAIPIEMKGIERKTDGASSRPSLTVANVLSTFSDAISITNKDLIGKRVVRRTTLKKYLVGEDDPGGTSSPPIEFPTEKFYIDRIAGENKVSITFELAAASDLEGLKLPNRIVIGKYCGWEYQGASRADRGGCIWPTNSKIKIGDTEHKAYFNIEDCPIILESDAVAKIATPYNASHQYGPNNWVTYDSKYWRSDSSAHTGNTPSDTSSFWQRIKTYTVWTGSGSDYTYNSSEFTYVERANTIWRILRDTPVEEEPSADSTYWTRGDLCGKVLKSCKSRFQFTPAATALTAAAPNTFPATEKRTQEILPFGGFPGSEKYR